MPFKLSEFYRGVPWRERSRSTGGVDGLALSSPVDPTPRRCWRCAGHGYIEGPDRYGNFDACPLCEGSGRLPLAH